MAMDDGHGELRRLLRSPPSGVATAMIPEDDRFDHRVVRVNCVFAWTVGVNEGYVEWFPNHDPPDGQETLGWIWVIRPDLSRQIIDVAISDRLKNVIQEYIDHPELR
jgi:hypothetical protein